MKKIMAIAAVTITALFSAAVTVSAAECEKSFTTYEISKDCIDVISIEDMSYRIAELEEGCLNANVHYKADTEADAVDIIRNCLVNRNETVYIEINYAKSVSPEYLKNRACEERVNAPSNEGDYLKGSITSFGSVVQMRDSYTLLAYSFSYNDDYDMEDKVGRAVTSILDSLSLKDKSDYEKSLAIHDYIAANVECQNTTDVHSRSGYAAAVNKLSDSHGLALLYYRLAKQAGLFVRYIEGYTIKSSENSRAWNLVRIDGKWYAVDVSWDLRKDASGNINVLHDYFLCGSNEFYSHSPEREYLSSKFISEQPLQAVAYNEPSKLYDDMNPSVEFDDLEKEGITYSTASLTDRAKLIIFGNYLGKGVGITAKLFEGLNKKDFSDSIDVNVFPLDDTEASYQGMKELKKDYADGRGYIFGKYSKEVYDWYVGNYSENTDDHKSAYVFVIDTAGRIRYVLSDFYNADELDTRYLPRIIKGWKETASAGYEITGIKVTLGYDVVGDKQKKPVEYAEDVLGINMVEGGIKYLCATAYGDTPYLTNGVLNVSLSDSSVISYDDTALLVKALKPGKCTVTFTSASNPSIRRSVEFIVSEYEIPFVDVDFGKWYKNAVTYVYKNKLMSGTNGGRTFEPDATATREMLVQILYNMEDKPSVSGKVLFKDVISDKWYYNAVLWANTSGVSKGLSDYRFGIGENVSRQQVAVFLYNYADSIKHLDVSASADLLQYNDEGEIAGWAKKAMRWANAKGIINGKGNGRLDPKGDATRAEIAAMIMSFRKAYND